MPSRREGLWVFFGALWVYVASFAMRGQVFESRTRHPSRHLFCIERVQQSPLSLLASRMNHVSVRHSSVNSTMCYPITFAPSRLDVRYLNCAAPQTLCQPDHNFRTRPFRGSRIKISVWAPEFRWTNRSLSCPPVGVLESKRSAHPICVGSPFSARIPR